MNRSEPINELALALSKTQAELKGAKKDTNNPFFNSRYADLSACWDACREPLSKNQLSIIQCPSTEGDKVSIETILAHSSGQWISSIVSATPGYTDKSGEFILEKDSQAIGSCITYLRRYGLCAIVGIAPEDDDGNASTGGKFKKTVAEMEGHAERDLGKESNDLVISEPQRKRLYAICKSKSVSEESMKEYLHKMGVTSSKDIKRKDYDAICGMIESGALSKEESLTL